MNGAALIRTVADRTWTRSRGTTNGFADVATAFAGTWSVAARPAKAADRIATGAGDIETVADDTAVAAGDTATAADDTMTSSRVIANRSDDLRTLAHDTAADPCTTRIRPARTDAARRGTTPRVHITLFPFGGSMKTTQVRTFDAGRRVEGFLDANATINSTAGQLRCGRSSTRR